MGKRDPVVPFIRVADCGHRPAISSHASRMLTLRVLPALRDQRGDGIRQCLNGA